MDRVGIELLSRFRYRKVPADLSCEKIGDLGVSRDCLNRASGNRRSFPVFCLDSGEDLLAGNQLHLAGLNLGHATFRLLIDWQVEARQELLNQAQTGVYWIGPLKHMLYGEAMMICESRTGPAQPGAWLGVPHSVMCRPCSQRRRPPPSGLTRQPAGGSVPAVSGSPGSEPRLGHSRGRFIPSGTGVSPSSISSFQSGILSIRDWVRYPGFGSFERKGRSTNGTSCAGEGE